MKISLVPKTKLGSWAATLTILFVALMVIKLSALSRTLRLPLPTPIIAVFGLLGFLLGLIAVFKNKDRSLLTLFTIPVGLMIIFWMAAELLFPH